MHKILPAALTALALSALAPAASQAGVAGMAHSEGRLVVYSANPGETNHVTVSRQGNDVVFEDASAPIAAGLGCTRVTERRVLCGQTGGVLVSLGDGNDRAVAPAEMTPAADYSMLDGEQGDDEVIGSRYLSGGAGNDVLRGGPGTEGYNAVEVLGFGAFDSQPTALIEPDRVVCARRPPGGVPASVSADRTDTLEGPCPRTDRVTRSEPAPKPEPAKRPGRCKRASTARGAKRLARNRYGAVWVKGLNHYACLYSRGRVTELRDEGGGIEARNPKPVIKGRYVAYVTRGSAVGDEFDRVVVWDLRQARVFFRANSTRVRDLAVKRNGSVAWTAQSFVEWQLDRPLWEVRRMSSHDRRGDELVDRGTGIRPTSLALWRNQRTISWRKDGRRRTATLP